MGRITYNQLAEQLGVNKSTVQRYVKLGMPSLKEGTKKTFNLADCKSWMEANKLTGNIGRNPAEVSEQKKAADLRKTLAMAALKELELKTKQGVVVDKASVEAANVEKFTTIRQALLALPASLAPTLEGQNVPDIQAIIEDQIREVLKELSKQ